METRSAVDWLTKVAEWIGGNGWEDWKTRRIARDRLLLQREIIRYQLDVIDEDTAELVRLPSYDTVLRWHIPDMDAWKAREELNHVEETT